MGQNIWNWGLVTFIGEEKNNGWTKPKKVKNLSYFNLG